MNFGGDEVLYDYSGSGIIIVPVPYDETSTWIKGADKGPDAVRKLQLISSFMTLKQELKLIFMVFTQLHR